MAAEPEDSEDQDTTRRRTETNVGERNARYLSIQSIAAAISIAVVFTGVGVWVGKQPGTESTENYNLIPTDRRLALKGEWRGTAYQEKGPTGEPIEAAVSATLDTSRKEIFGEISYRYSIDGKEYLSDMDLNGGFLYEKYLQLHYRHQKSTVIQIGSAVLELNAQGTILKGRFVGYGDITEGLVYGSVELQKQP